MACMVILGQRSSESTLGASNRWTSPQKDFAHPPKLYLLYCFNFCWKQWSRVPSLFWIPWILKINCVVIISKSCLLSALARTSLGDSFSKHPRELKTQMIIAFFQNSQGNLKHTRFQNTKWYITCNDDVPARVSRASAILNKYFDLHFKNEKNGRVDMVQNYFEVYHKHVLDILAVSSV